MEKFDSSKIKSIEMVFENCESIKFPIECFEQLEIYKDDDNWFNFSCHIVDNGSAEYYCSMYKISPCQRIEKHADICSLTIIDTDGYSHCGSVLWADDDYQINDLQISNLISYKEVKVSVERSNKKYTIQEVLNGLKEGVVVVDEFGNEYKIANEHGFNLFYEQKDDHFVQTPVSNWILDRMFTIKVK